jgi:hypothetical protein
MIILLIIAAIVVFIGIYFYVGIKHVNEVLTNWARQVLSTELNDNERLALVGLYGCFQLKKIPNASEDPLRKLSIEELSHLKKMCEPDYLPEKLRGRKKADFIFWGSSFLANKKKGYSDDQAQIISGLLMNRYANVIDETIKFTK